jgi:hypothetical protein
MHISMYVHRYMQVLPDEQHNTMTAADATAAACSDPDMATRPAVSAGGSPCGREAAQQRQPPVPPEKASPSDRALSTFMPGATTSGFTRRSEAARTSPNIPAPAPAPAPPPPPALSAK